MVDLSIFLTVDSSEPNETASSGNNVSREYKNSHDLGELHDLDDFTGLCRDCAQFEQFIAKASVAPKMQKSKSIAKKAQIAVNRIKSMLKLR